MRFNVRLALYGAAIALGLTTYIVVLIGLPSGVTNLHQLPYGYSLVVSIGAFVGGVERGGHNAKYTEARW